MPGAGKSETISYIKSKGIPCVRFGQLTDEGLSKDGLPVTPENEQKFREKLRVEFGMAAYAIQSKPKIDAALAKNKIVAIDGLYSWEEYLYLKQQYNNLILMAVVTDAKKRYTRLSNREIRPLSHEEAQLRDIAEIEKLNKGGPIAIADSYIENNDDDKQVLYSKIDVVLEKIQ